MSIASLAVPAVEPVEEIVKACVACGLSVESPAILVMGARIHGPDIENIPFKYFMCAECGTLNIVDIPEDLGSYYDRGYYSFAPRAEPSGLRRKIKGLRDGLLAGGRGAIAGIVARLFPYTSLLSLRPMGDGRVAAFGRSARILDLGCGSGLLLRQLRAAGYSDLTGADPFMKQEIDEPGFRMRRGEARDLEGAYDIVMMHHAFEHVVDPFATITAIRRLMAPGSVLLLRVPVVGGEAWQTYGGNWGQLDAPLHLWLFSDEGMKRLVARAGFELKLRLWDSEEHQFTLSELRNAGLSIHQGKPAQNWLAEHVTPAQHKQFVARAKELNRAGKGDQASYYMALSKPN